MSNSRKPRRQTTCDWCSQYVAHGLTFGIIGDEDDEDALDFLGHARCLDQARATYERTKDQRPRR